MANFCKNCNEKLSKRGKFCPACGQPEFTGVVTMRSLLSKFLSNLTHLDNKFIKAAGHLLVPARVTRNYFAGRIKRYPHPLQFFFIVMFFFLLLFSKQFDGVAVNVLGGSLNFGGEDTYSEVESGVTVSKSTLYEGLSRCVAAREYKDAFDSLPASLQTPDSRRAFNMVHQKVGAPWEIATTGMLGMLNDSSMNYVSSLDTISLNFEIASIRISTRDFVLLEPDSIINKYQVQGWKNQMLVRQSIKTIRDQQGLIHRYVGSFGWAVLALIATLALLMKALYWRANAYYVTHFIFLMHHQSGVFLVLTLALAVQEYLFSLNELWLVVFGWVGVSLLLAMQNFYCEKWWKTILKWLLLCGLYLVLLTSLFVGTLLIVFAIF